MASENDDDDSVWQDGSMRLSRANSAATGSSGYLTATDGSTSDSSNHKVGGGELLTPSTSAASRRTKSSGEVLTPSTSAALRRTKSDSQRVIPAQYVSERIQRLAKQRSEFVGSELEFEIEASKDHWSELSPELLNGLDAGQDLKKNQQQNRSGLKADARLDGKNVKSRSSCGRVVKEFCGYLRIASRKKDNGDPTSNRVVFETLRKNPQWAKFLEPFGSDNPASTSARKMAEGAQAEIYDSSGFTVYKVFKSPHSLRDLHKQWPHGMLLKGKQIYSMAHALGLDIPISISEMMPSISLGAYFHELNTAGSFGGVLLEDGRFALVMKKYDGDLRTLIDAHMLQNGNQGPPFGYEMAKWMMRQIAVGMNGLHRDCIVHRDLKASNVLYEVSGVGGIDLAVADYECSARVLGTGFWRAPEILKALPDVPVYAFSEKSDVYSYAMTCYEILTGCLPFENQPSSEVGVVVCEGQRPELPAFVEPSVRDLIGSCWHENPAKRPAFGVILKKWREICV